MRPRLEPVDARVGRRSGMVKRALAVLVSMGTIAAVGSAAWVANAATQAPSGELVITVVDVDDTLVGGACLAFPHPEGIGFGL